MKRKHKSILKDYKYFFKGRKKWDLKVSSKVIESKIRGKKLHEIVKYQQKHIEVLKTRNARLWYDLRLMISQQEEYLKKELEFIRSRKRSKDEGN